MADTSVIGLPEAIRGLRAELSEAMKEGASEELRFKVGPVELEFVVEVSREAGATGGVKFWVVSLEAKGTAGRTATHRVKLALTPITTRGKDLEVRGRVARRPA
jgi:Trypsin-co-occurring domain 2